MSHLGAQNHGDQLTEAVSEIGGDAFPSFRNVKYRNVKRKIISPEFSVTLSKAQEVAFLNYNGGRVLEWQCPQDNWGMRYRYFKHRLFADSTFARSLFSNFAVLMLHLRCAAHMLQLAVLDALKPTVASGIVQKARKVVKTMRLQTVLLPLASESQSEEARLEIRNEVNFDRDHDATIAEAETVLLRVYRRR